VVVVVVLVVVVVKGAYFDRQGVSGNAWEGS
jgi:hypothetical protein